MKKTKYREQYDNIIDLTDKKSRGKLFETLILSILDDADILINETFRTLGNSQEIDGAIEINGRIFLIEIKWERTETLAASKLFSFLGKINSKMEGTLGIFISHNHLKEEFVKAVRNGLRQNCILIHGEENIHNIIDGKVNLKDFIWYAFQKASMKNVAEVSTAEFASIPSKKELAGKIETKKPWTKIYEKLVDRGSGKGFENFVRDFYEVGNDIPEKFVSALPALDYTAWTSDKIEAIRKVIIETEKEKYIRAWRSKFLGEFWDKYSSRAVLDLMPTVQDFKKQTRIKIIEKITSSFNGDFERENQASRIFKRFWAVFSVEEFVLLARKYLEIHLDTFRGSSFDQKLFARDLFHQLQKSKVDIWDEFDGEIRAQLSSYLDDWTIFGGGGSTVEEESELASKTCYGKMKKLFEGEEKVEVLQRLQEIYMKLRSE